MDWHGIAKGLKHLIVTVASPRNTVQEIDSQANHSSRSAVSGSEGYDDARVRPYTPDSHGERNDSSRHMSC